VITFQVKTQAFDTMNAPIDGTWATTSPPNFDVPAEKVSESSREYSDMLKKNSEMTALFRIRYQAGIDSDTYRIQFCLDPDASPPNVQTFDIDPPIDPTGRRIELLISGKEIR